MQSPDNNLKIRLVFVGDPVISTKAPEQVENGISAEDIKIQFGVRVVVDRPASKVDVVVTFSYFTGAITLFSGSLTSSFEVLDLASLIQTQDGEDGFRLESDFLPILINIAFSNTRGYFVNELRSSALAPYPFPIVSMDSIKKRTTYKLI